MGLAQKYDQIPPGRGRTRVSSKGDAASVEEYVTRKALDGLYLMISEEEHAIRTDIPRLRASAIVTKVFDALALEGRAEYSAGSRDAAPARR